VVICRGFFLRTIGTDGPSVLDVLARRPEPGDLIWDGPPRRRLGEGAEPEAEPSPAPVVAGSAS
jgi:hypothetical protein